MTHDMGDRKIPSHSLYYLFLGHGDVVMGAVDNVQSNENISLSTNIASKQAS